MDGHMNLSSYLLINVTLTIWNWGAYLMKYFLESEDEYFVDMVEAILTKYTQENLTNIVLSENDDKDPDKVEVQALLARIKSIKCVGKKMEIFKLL